MGSKDFTRLLLIGGLIRIILYSSSYSTEISNRVEVSTPLNSYKRVQEGIYLYKHKIDPYDGDIVHEIPLVIAGMAWFCTACPLLVPFLYIVLDLLIAFVLHEMSSEFIKQLFEKQKGQIANFAADTEELQLQVEDLTVIPKFVFMAYLFNPFSILNCVGLTSTVFSNLLLALFLYSLSKRYLLPSLVLLALESTRNLYPTVLIAPVVLIFGKGCVKASTKVVIMFTVTCAAVCFLNYWIIGSWAFLNGTLGFVFSCRELQPNIGLFWYFFMEMFDHFRTMFLITFQMNATILYLIPLSLKLRKDPIMLSTVLISLTSIFRSYPCLGDITFYLALLPMWRRCWKFMAHNFVVFCFFLITGLMMPALWYLWIYAGSANANFYFGTTLAFSTGQIFLITDLLFAYVKREFCLKHGQKVFIDGKEAKIILE